MQYRKKRVVIEAIQWRPDNLLKVQNFAKGMTLYVPEYRGQEALFVSTLEGVTKARVYDWIIRGVDGEYYPCKPDVFSKTYEKFDPPDSQ